jgi:hypothetical protein
MTSDYTRGCEESRTTYFLEVERERDGVRVRTRMRREHDDILSGGGEGAWRCQIVDANAKRAG